jgi:hypothetical protein
MSLLVPSNRSSDDISVVETNNLTSDQISLVKYLRENPVVAAKVLLGVTLEWYQAEALNDVWRKRFSIFCCSRQICKTFMEAVLFALIGALYPDEDCVFIAPSLRQSMNPFNYIRGFYAEHPMFRSMIRGKMTKTALEYKNNSTIRPLPLGDGSKILGTHASVIGIDEYARFSKDIIDTIIMPMANRKKNPYSRGNRVSIISTPLSKANHYYQTFCQYQKEQQLNPTGDYHVSTYNFLDSDHVDLDVFTNQIKSMPFERFARENLAMFTSNVGGFFSEELLRQCEDEIPIELLGEEGYEYVMGIDPPSVNNQLGICLFKLTENNQKLELVYCCGIPAGYITTPQLVGLILRFVKRFNIKRIHMDEGGGGRQIAGYLFSPGVIVDEYDCPVKILLPPKGDEIMQWAGARDADDPIAMNNSKLEPLVVKLTSFNPHNKSAMYFNVRNAMQDGAILMPAYHPGDDVFVETNTLQGELEGLKGDLTASSILLLRKPDNLYDDRADAFVLAYDAFLGYMRKGNFPKAVRGLGHSDNIGGDANWFGRRDIGFPDRSDW